jgi:outer membrane protein assembly factor BamB
MSRNISGALSLILSSALLLTACSSSSEGSASSQGSASAEPSMASFDEPKQFDGEPVPITFRALDTNMAGNFTNRFTLSGDKAYGVTKTSVGAVDLRTGELVWETRFPNGPDEAPAQIMYDSRGPGAPVLSEDGSTVYGVLVVEIPGSGTTSESYAIQLVAVDADTGDLSWTADIPAGPGVYQARGESAHVVAEADGRVIVSRDGDGYSVTSGTVSAVDTTTHKVLWSRPGSAYAITPEAVITKAGNGKANGAVYPQLMGLDPATGEVKWTGGDNADTAVSAVTTLQTDAGFVVTIHPYTGADPYTGILDPTTGKITKRLPGVVLYHPIRDGDAVYDVSNAEGLRALDPSTFEPIWTLPEGNRIAPKNPVFFDGLVYGQVKNNMSVILDGKTGADVTADIPGYFIVVNEHGAIMLRNREVVFVPATG